MKKCLPFLKLFSVVFALMLMASVANAANRFSVATGPWGSTATWAATSGGAPGATAPVAGDVVTIENTFIVTVGANAACATLNVTTGSLVIGGFNFTVSGTSTLSGSVTINSITGTKSFGTLVINSGGDFNSTVNEDYALTGNLQVNGTGNITSGTGTWTFAGGSTLSGTGSATISKAVFQNDFTNTGTYSFTDLDVSGGGSVQLNNGGTISVASTLTGSDDFVQQAAGIFNFAGTTIAINTFTASAAGNQVNYNGAAQTVRATTYSDLTFSGSGTKTAAGILDVNGIMTIGTGTTLAGSTFAHTMAGNWINNGTYTAGTGTVTFDGSATQSIGGTASTTFNNLTINGASTTVTLGLTTAVAGNLSISGGETLDLSTFSLNRTAGGGTLTVSGIMKLGAASGGQTGSNFPTNFTTVTLTGGTVEYNGSNAITQTVFATPTYENLTLTNGTGSGNSDKVSTASFAVNGTMTVNANVTFTPSATDVLSGSSNVIGGTGTIKVTRIAATPDYNSQYGFTTDNLAAMTVDYAGAGAQTVNPFTYGNLVTSGSGIKTAAGIMDVNANVTIGTGTTLTGATFAHNVGGNWINNGTFTANTSTVTFNGTTQSIGGSASTTFNNLTIDGPSTTTLGINTSVAGNLNITTGDILDLSTFTINRTAAGGTLTVAGTMRLGGTTGGQTGSNFPTNYTTLTMTGGTVNYNAATGGQTIYAVPTYVTLTMGNTSGTQTAGGNITTTTLNNNTNAADILDMGTNTLTVTTVNNTGTIKTQNTSATPLSAGRTWGGTVEYNGAGQSIVAGTYNDLVTSNSGTKTMSAATTVSGDVTIGTNTTLDEAAITMTLGTGSIVTVNGTLDFTSSTGLIRTGNNLAATLTMGAAGKIRTLDLTGLGPVANASLQTQGSGTWNTTSVNTNGTVEYYGAATQVVTDRDYNNLTITNAGTKTWTLAAARTINGVVHINAAAPLTLSGTFQVSILGGSVAWTNDGTFTAGTSTIRFAGSALQILFGTGPTTFTNLTVANAAGLNLQQDQFVNGIMTFTNGIVLTDATNLLTFNSGATVAGTVSNTTHVDGPVRKLGNVPATFTFPTGDAGQYEYIEITGGTASNDFTAEYLRTSATALGTTYTSPVKNVSACDHWTLGQNAGANTLTVKLSWSDLFPCGGTTPFVTDPSKLTVAHLTGGTTWDEAGNPGGSTAFFGISNSGWVSRSNVTVFSPFSLGNTAEFVNPLPVLFGDVKAFEKGTGVQIEWTNLTEKDVVNYTVEHSVNGRDFTTISLVASRSNLSDAQSYLSFDGAPAASANFYRIKVLEADGKIIYSKLLKVNIGGKQTGIVLYPNPVVGNDLSIGFTAARGQYTLSIVNAAGQQVYTKSLNHAGGTVSQAITLPATVKTGVYNMVISGDNYRETKMFVIQ